MGLTLKDRTIIETGQTGTAPQRLRKAWDTIYAELARGHIGGRLAALPRC